MRDIFLLNELWLYGLITNVISFGPLLNKKTSFTVRIPFSRSIPIKYCLATSGFMAEGNFKSKTYIPSFPFRRLEYKRIVLIACRGPQFKLAKIISYLGPAASNFNFLYESDLLRSASLCVEHWCSLQVSHVVYCLIWMLPVCI